MNPIDEMVKIERKFLEEYEAIKNENGVYVYKSDCGKEIFSLDHYLCEYKEWLIKNGYITHIKES